MRTARSSVAADRQCLRVLVVDDHPIVRKGACAWLTRRLGYEIAGEARSALEALRIARKCRPDLVLMDFDLPGINGLAACRLLRKKVPQAKVLIFCMRRDVDLGQGMADCGASGSVLKTASAGELLEAIEAAVLHEPPCPLSEPAFSVQQASSSGGAERLSAREQEILCRIANGESNKEIARMLGISQRTVRTHRERLIRKLNIHKVVDLTKFAINYGLVSVRADA